MLASYRWLQELVPGLDVPPAELADRLTNAGLELDAIIEFGAGLEKVVVARVEKIEKHPKRDKLQLVTVDRGEADHQTVVCGASNVPAPGGLVALAGVGTHLPAIGITLDAREIGGVPSEGMLCSEKELGLAEESDGILVLPADLEAKPGTPLSEALPECQDTILDLGITPNRPDALSHVGLAREISALFRLETELPTAGTPARSADEKVTELASVDNQDTERCPHYGARAALDVKIATSPNWLRWRLQSLGVRPISNVVDITNLLLLEMGQPMHAFDLELVRDKKIVVRRAAEGEPMRTLDGVDRKLSSDDLVICDGRGPVALAGVMGGENTEIRETTRHVLLECAYFTPRGVRRTSRRQSLSSESSFRFERGVDWARVPEVLDRATTLLTELAGGSAAEGAIHAAGKAPEIPTIELRAQRMNALLGVEIDFGEALDILQRLGLEVVSRNAEVAQVRGASFRPDISIEADLIEEVARVHGVDHIPTVLPAIPPQPPRTSGKLERSAKEAAVGLGLSEAIAYSFVSRAELAAVLAPEPVVELQNPLSEERSVMRSSLLPGLLEALKRARRHGERSVRLFSVGPVFLAATDAARSEAARAARPELEGDRGVLPEERPMLTAVLAGPRDEYLMARPPEVDVYDAKGVAEALVLQLTRRRLQVGPGADAKHLHPRGAGKLLVEGSVVGQIGPLHPDVIDALDLDGTAQVIELDLLALETLGKQTPHYQPIPRLPAVTRDIALMVKDSTPADDVASAISGAAGELCESVELFDLFTGGNVPDGHRSLAFRVVYRDPKAATDPDNARTLTDKEVDKRHQAVVKATEQALGAVLRA